MPIPREGHTLVTLTDPAHNQPTLDAPVLFGGTDSVGHLIENPPLDVWTLNREVGGEQDQDYRYRWVKVHLATSSPHPADRTEHTAVAVSPAEMLIFGGTNDAGQEFWRLYKDALDDKWKWATVTASGSAPAARFGHTAVYDEHAYPAPFNTTVRRMILYGGSPTLGGAPGDNKVYIFTFSGSGFSSGTWSVKNLPDGPPPLYDHAMVISPHPWSSEPPGRRIAWIYGGCSGGCSGTPTTSNVLWRLEMGADDPDNIVWTYANPAAGANPGARIGHMMFFDRQSERISIVGGSATNQHLFQIVRDLDGDADWIQGAEAPVALTGHAVCFDPNGFKVVARIPEIYDPASNTWTSQPLAARSEQYYPQQFLVPRIPFRGDSCRVVVVGPSKKSLYLDVPNTGQAPRWNSFANPDPGFASFTSVMYQPGKVLAAGGVEPPQNWWEPPTITGMAALLDAGAIPNGVGWQQTNSMSYERYFHNLVLLPDGHVLAVGGMTHAPANGIWNPADAQYTPEWWNPASGTWTSLAQQSNVVRNYHSTALLLPDGRVLSGGGWWFDADTKDSLNPNMKRLQIFCPPYLFNSSGGPATRPAIAGAPATITWRQRFTVCVSDTAHIRSACLIRAGATTHGLDMSQRFVPLTIEGHAGSPQRLFLTAPASPDSAPPGDYLLFVLGSADRDDVPSIARWVRLQASGDDWCDVVSGSTISDLTPEIVGSTSIFLTWTATADDGTLAASGRAREFDLRYTYVNPITSEASWDIAPWATGEPVPGETGTAHQYTLESLQSCTDYYIALRSKDDQPNLSGLHSSVSVRTTCGGGGGEFSAREVAPGENDAGGAVSSAAPGAVRPDATGIASTGRGAEVAAGAPAPTPGLLVAETRGEPDGGWRITLRLVEPPPGSGSSPATVTVEQGDPDGTPDTLGRFEPRAEDHLLGLCSLRERGRLGIPGVYRIERIESQVKSRAGDQEFSAAVHSRLGPFGAEFVAAGGSVELALGDTLDLTYSPATAPLPDAADWYALVRRTGEAPPIPMNARRGSLGESLPARFALYQNRPNPFRGTTVIPFDLPSESPVSLAVFDVLGRRIATLVDGTLPAGSHTAEWNLRDQSGARVPPGVYTYRIAAGAFHERRKMTVLP